MMNIREKIFRFSLPLLAWLLAAPAGAGTILEDFSGETPGAQPRSFTPAVGNWYIGLDGDNKVTRRAPFMVSATRSSSTMSPPSPITPLPSSTR